MPILARYLQDEFGRHCPAGWACRPEAAVVSDRTRRMLGYYSGLSDGSSIQCQAGLAAGREGSMAGEHSW